MGEKSFECSDSILELMFVPTMPSVHSPNDKCGTRTLSSETVDAVLCSLWMHNIKSSRMFHCCDVATNLNAVNKPTAEGIRPNKVLQTVNLTPIETQE